ncbi:MAG: hypothetical protein LQ346_008150 [Caloplaca aetnensis]|nr:MAG: hypothetical protein LQ346_008150 [Caloplaca aetnensis]
MQKHWILPLIGLLPFLTHAVPVEAGDASGGNQQEYEDFCPDYKTCGSKGLQYWNWLQGNISSPGLVDRTDGKATYDRSYLSDSRLLDAGILRPEDLLNHALPNLDDPAYTYWLISSISPDTGVESEEVAYKNAINTRDGVLIALSNFREVDEARTLPWSELMYQTWQESKAKDNERTSKTGLEGHDLSTLQHSIQHTIVNAQTLQIMELIYSTTGYPTRQDTKWRKWTEEETPNWFFALLGTDNCKGTVFLLTQHAVEAGKKEVAEIWTFWDEEFPNIW